MTIPVPLSAFDHAHAIKPKPALGPLDRGKLASIGLTLAFHVAAVTGLLAMVHVAPVRLPRVMMVVIHQDKPKQKADDLPLPPQMVQPTVVSVPLPVVLPTAPAPVTAAAPPAAGSPVPPPPASAPKAENDQARQDFVARLLAQLNRFKQYPRAARQARIQGVVMLHFVMDAGGRVLWADIAKSSGRPVLDAEALALIQRAQPLPPLPADFPSRTLDAVVPVEFSLNG